MDRQEFKQSILPHYKHMYSVSLAILGDSDDASDAVQEAMAKLWEKRGEIDGKDSYEAFCLRVVKNVCLDKMRAAREHTDLDVATGMGAINDTMEKRETINVIRQLACSLGESQRQVFMLATFGECDNDEIADATGYTESNVRQLLSRARKRIKELYQSYER